MLKTFNYFKLIAGFIFLSFCIASCGSDDDPDPNTSNQFTIDGVSHSLDKGLLENWGQLDDNTFDFDVYLYSNGLTYSTQDDEFSGTGNFMYIDFNTSSSNGLVDGTYTFSTNREAFTFAVAGAAGDFDTTTDDISDLAFGLTGSITVSTSGNETIIEFDLKTFDNKSITGKYQGELQNI